MTLPWLVLRERRSMRIVNAPAAAVKTIAMVNALPPFGLELSTGFASAFVCTSGVVGGMAFVRTMFVRPADTAGGGGFDAVVICGRFVVCGGLVGGGLNVVRESRLVPTFVPTMTSGGAVMTTGRGWDGGGLVLTDATG